MGQQPARNFQITEIKVSLEQQNGQGLAKLTGRNRQNKRLIPPPARPT
jgi:hypothetical protein